jgi:hypothetical protein
VSLLSVLVASHPDAGLDVVAASAAEPEPKLSENLHVQMSWPSMSLFIEIVVDDNQVAHPAGRGRVPRPCRKWCLILAATCVAH